MACGSICSCLSPIVTSRSSQQPGNALIIALPAPKQPEFKDLCPASIDFCLIVGFRMFQAGDIFNCATSWMNRTGVPYDDFVSSLTRLYSMGILRKKTSSSLDISGFGVQVSTRPTLVAPPFQVALLLSLEIRDTAICIAGALAALELGTLSEFEGYPVIDSNSGLPRIHEAMRLFMSSERASGHKLTLSMARGNLGWLGLPEIPQDIAELDHHRKTCVIESFFAPLLALDHVAVGQAFKPQTSASVDADRKEKPTAERPTSKGTIVELHLQCLTRAHEVRANMHPEQVLTCIEDECICSLHRDARMLYHVPRPGGLPSTVISRAHVSPNRSPSDRAAHSIL